MCTGQLWLRVALKLEMWQEHDFAGMAFIDATLLWSQEAMPDLNVELVFHNRSNYK